jgi:hypothetical protein
LGSKDPNSHLSAKRPLTSFAADLDAVESKRPRFAPETSIVDISSAAHMELQEILDQAIGMDDGDDWSDCSDFGDLEEEANDDRNDTIPTGSESIAYPDPHRDSVDESIGAFAGSSTLGTEGTTEVSERMHFEAVNILCRAFPNKASEIRDFFSREWDDDDPMYAINHAERHETFRRVEVAISGMPDEDIPRPSGQPHMARLGWQLNHPTERCSEKPGETLDDKSPTTRLMMKKGVDNIFSFTYDTINRRAVIRRVEENGKRRRTYKTEPKTWDKAHQEVHHDYVKWIWENLPYKINLVCGGENRDLMVPMMNLKLHKVKIDSFHSVDVAMWRKSTGEIGKVAIFIWHPEYIIRSRRLKVARAYDAFVNFACDLARLPIRRDYFEASLQTYKSQCTTTPKSAPQADQKRASIRAWVTPTSVTTDALDASSSLRAFAEEDEFSAIDDEDFLAAEREIPARAPYGVQGPSAPELKSPVRAQPAKRAAPPAQVAKPQPGSVTSSSAPQSKGSKAPQKGQAGSQSEANSTDSDHFWRLQKAVIYEVLKEDMCHEVVPLELLPASFLAHLLESEERQEHYLFCMSRDYTPARAVLAVVDPQGEAQQRHASLSMQETHRVRALINGIVAAISRAPSSGEPSSVPIKCQSAVCGFTSVDHEPKYLVDSDRYILSKFCRSHGVCRPTASTLHWISQWTIERRIKAVLGKSGLMASNEEDIIRIAQVVKVESLRDDEADSRNLQIDGTKGVNDLRRGPLENDPKEIQVICKACMKTRTVDKKPKFAIKGGQYLARHFPCKEPGCKPGHRGNIFIPHYPEGTREADKIAWVTQKSIEKEVNEINKAAKIRAGHEPAPAKLKSLAKKDVLASCEKKPGVTRKVTVCNSCKKTEYVDSDPFFYRDTQGLKYVHHTRDTCRCDGKKSHPFIPKPVDDGQLEATIAFNTLKRRLEKERSVST